MEQVCFHSNLNLKNPKLKHQKSGTICPSVHLQSCHLPYSKVHTYTRKKKVPYPPNTLFLAPSFCGAGDGTPGILPLSYSPFFILRQQGLAKLTRLASNLCFSGLSLLSYWGYRHALPRLAHPHILSEGPNPSNLGKLFLRFYPAYLHYARTKRQLDPK